MEKEINKEVLDALDEMVKEIRGKEPPKHE